MKKLRVCAILLIGFMIMGGTAWAWNTTDHVKVAPGGKGDLIIFPWYIAMAGGWETKLSVINTSNTYSTVAKVVVRSENWSQEVLDFLIYLSPNDVWTGTLKNDIAGTVLYSADDSILRRNPGAVIVAEDFASGAFPVTQPLFSVDCPTSVTYGGDSNQKGYVEVIEAAATTGLTKIAGTNKVAKTTIYTWYSTQVFAPVPQADTPNILTGYQEFRNILSSSPVETYDALSRAEVFADWNSTAKLDVTRATGITEESRNTIGELEAAMSKSDVALPYISSLNGDYAVHIFNFPTKLSLAESTCLQYDAYSESPYFMNFGNLIKCEEYMPNVYDMLEGTTATSGSPFSGGDAGNPTMCKEVEMIQTTFIDPLFREGWIRYNWAGTQGLKAFNTKSSSPLLNSFTGTPVLPVALFLKFNGGNTVATQAAAAFNEGVVTEGQVIYPYFQYSQYTTP